MYRSAPYDRTRMLNKTNKINTWQNGSYNCSWMGQGHFQVHSLNIRKPLLMTQTPLSTISATTYLAHTNQSLSQPIRKTSERGKMYVFNLLETLRKEEYWLEHRSAIAGTPADRTSIRAGEKRLEELSSCWTTTWNNITLAPTSTQVQLALTVGPE